MQRLLAAAAATAVLTIASAALAQPYSGPPGAPYAPSASAWRASPYSSSRPYRDDRAYYGGARYDYGGRPSYGGRSSYDDTHGSNPRYDAYGYAPNRAYGGWGARFTLPFRSHTPSHR